MKSRKIELYFLRFAIFEDAKEYLEYAQIYHRGDSNCPKLSMEPDQGGWSVACQYEPSGFHPESELLLLSELRSVFDDSDTEVDDEGWLMEAYHEEIRRFDRDVTWMEEYYSGRSVGPEEDY